MKSKAVLAFAVPVLMLTMPAVAQDSTRADFEEFCKAMRGRWVGEVIWITDWEGLGKKGDKVRCYSDNRVTEDGNAILSKFYGGSGSGTAVYFYDAAAREIKQTVITSGGSTWTTVFHKENEKWVGIEEGSTPDGEKIEGKIAFSVSDNGNKHTFSGSLTIGGKRTDELRDVWVRVSDE